MRLSMELEEWIIFFYSTQYCARYTDTPIYQPIQDKIWGKAWISLLAVELWEALLTGASTKSGWCVHWSLSWSWIFVKTMLTAKANLFQFFPLSSSCCRRWTANAAPARLKPKLKSSLYSHWTAARPISFHTARQVGRKSEWQSEPDHENLWISLYGFKSPADDLLWLPLKYCFKRRANER